MTDGEYEEAFYADPDPPGEDEMSDYKYEIQMIAEELAEERHGCGFYGIPDDDTRFKLYQEATEIWTDKVMARADALSDQERGC